MSLSRLAACIIAAASGAFAQTPPATEIRELHKYAAIGGSPDRLAAATVYVQCPDGSPMHHGGASVLNFGEGPRAPVAITATKAVLSGRGWLAEAGEMVESGDATANHFLRASALCEMPVSPLNPHIKVVTQSAGLFPNSTPWESITATAACPAGYWILGGGADLSRFEDLPADGIRLTASKATSTGWTATALEEGNGSPVSVSLKAYVICADGTSGFSAPTSVTRTSNFPDDPGTNDEAGSAAACGSGKTLTGASTEILTADGSAPRMTSLLQSGPVINLPMSWETGAVETQDLVRGPAALRLVTRLHCFTKSAAVRNIARYGSLGSFDDQEGVKDFMVSTASCPPGKFLIGGGAEVFGQGNPADLALMGSHPYFNGWRAVVRETADVDRSELDLSVAAYALCAELPL